MLIPFLLLVLSSSVLGWNCPEVTPSVCGDDEVTCDKGTHNYCWTGDYCLPAGSVCPEPCFTTTGWSSTCHSGQLTCESWRGHCKMLEYCIANIPGQVCPPSCKIENPAVCLDTDVICDAGNDDDGCWLGQSCLPAGSTCP